MFSTSIPSISIAFTIITVLAAILACTYGLWAYRRAASTSNREKPSVLSDQSDKSDLSDLSDLSDQSYHEIPKASLVIYCQSPLDTLASTLEMIESQDYPNRETIVVCDAGEEFAAEAAEMTAARFRNVYVTFLPQGSHNLSRRKLANTIGIKAAKGDVVLTTTANIEIPSSQWLSDMMAPFTGDSGNEILYSLGATMIDFNELHGAGKWYRQFDSLLSDALWIGYAAAGHPYRGDAFNMAFRRDFFFRNKGYAPTNHLHNGDDDVQLQGICNRSNTGVVASKGNILLTKWDQSANRVWRMRKAQYGFTKRWLPHSPFFRNATLSAMQWLVPACAVAASLLALPSLIPAIICLTTVLAMWGCQIAVYRRLTAKMGAVRLWWAVVPFWLWRPLANFRFNLNQKGSRKKNYTWQR